MNGSVRFFTQVISHLLLVLLLPVYVNLVKELFPFALFLAVFATVFPKASAKVLLFSELTKFFGKYFQKIMLFHGLNDHNQGKKTIFGRYEQSVAEMRKSRKARQLLYICLFCCRITNSESTAIAEFLLEIIHYSHIRVTIRTKVDY